MRDMGHENEEDDDDNNNTNNNDDNDNDENDGDHVPQRQHTITREHPKTRGGRSRRPRRQQTQINSVQQDERLRHVFRRTHCGASSQY